MHRKPGELDSPSHRSVVRVVASAMAPPSSIPNLVVPHGSAGEYCAGNRVGGEAVAHTPQVLVEW